MQAIGTHALMPLFCHSIVLSFHTVCVLCIYIAEASGGGVVLREAKKFLIRYLKEVRTTTLAVGRREVS